MPRRPGSKDPTRQATKPAAKPRPRKTLVPPKIAAIIKRSLGLKGGAEVHLKVVAAGLHEIAEASDIDPDVRVRAYTELRQLYTSGWWVGEPVTLVRPQTGDDEQDVATLSTSALQAVASGQISPRGGEAMIRMANRAMDTSGLARLLRETAPLSGVGLAARVAGEERAAAATGLTAEHVNAAASPQGLVETSRRGLHPPRRPAWRIEAEQRAQELAAKTIEHEATNGANGHAEED